MAYPDSDFPTRHAQPTMTELEQRRVLKRAETILSKLEELDCILRPHYPSISSPPGHDSFRQSLMTWINELRSDSRPNPPTPAAVPR